MKKVFLLILAIVPAMLIAQQTYVPDDNFEQALIDFGYDTLPLNDSVPTKNIDTVTNLKVNRWKIKDLTGIEDFKALTYLYCSDNPLTSLDVSKNTALTGLYCSSNRLTSLDVSKNTALERLGCYENGLTSLDVSKNTALILLWCYENSLTSLDVSKNTALTDLLCYHNSLMSLDVAKNTALYVLDCSRNVLTSLDVSKNTALEWLACYYNPDLYCIQVADSALAENNLNWHKDGHAIYSKDCKYTGVEEASNIENISISPNPAGDYIEINNVILNEAKNPEIKIYDVVGVEVASTNMSFLRLRSNGEAHQESHGSFNEIPNQVGNDSQVVRIDVSELPKGVYFVSVGGQMYKFIKM